MRLSIFSFIISYVSTFMLGFSVGGLMINNEGDYIVMALYLIYSILFFRFGITAYRLRA